LGSVCGDRIAACYVEGKVQQFRHEGEDHGRTGPAQEAGAAPLQAVRRGSNLN
jgi:hypothetical protein